MVLSMMVATLTEVGQGTSPRSNPYGLSPMQSGMLFQALLGQSAGAAGGYDIEQILMRLDEPVDVRALGRAFDLLLARHPVLSTAFLWEEGGEPRQQLNPGVSVPLAVEDWQQADDAECAVRRRAYLEDDRARGFDLRKPPLMRLAVFRRAGNKTEVVWTFHHILIDGRCFAPLLREAFDAYQAVVEGTEWQPPPPPRPYRDFIAWLETIDPNASLPFFRQLLANKSAPTPLPVSEPVARPLPRNGYEERVTSLGDRTVEAIRRMAAATETTVATVIHAAWALVLARYTGDDDVVFGSARACRRSALGGDGEEMIGLFMNTLPVRARVSDATTVGDLLRDLRAQSVAMRAHEHTPLVTIHAASPIPGGTPLFETMLLYETHELNTTLRTSGGPEWQRRELTIHEQPALPLTIKVMDGARFEVAALYDRRRFRDAAIARLLDSVVITLERLAGARPGQRLGAIDVLPERERRRIVHDWNATAHPFPAELRIHELFEQRTDEQPDALAVEMDGQAVTFRELDQRANRLAHALRSRGAGPGRYVAICLSRGPNLVAALLGVAKSGAAYVPLDPRYPAERLAFMIEDTRAITVVTERVHEPQLGSASTHLVIDNEDGVAELARQPASRPAPLGRPTDACYAIFTSGSTGAPKGAVLSHRAVVNTLHWVSRTFQVGPGDRLLFVTSPCFDLSVYDTFGALGAGATVVVASESLLADPQALARAITEQRITIWDSAPAALQRLAPFFPAPGPHPLRLVLLSGDWIPLTLPDDIGRTFARAEVISLGGATEAAIWSNFYRVGRVDPRWTSIPYGRPIQNARYYVLDGAMRPVPVGVTGELYIGGTCLADGYLNRIDLTCERFLTDHLAGIPGERIYKTGDLARFVDDENLEPGTMEILGRADFQVKIRGFRVEMGEVEAALTALPGIREAVAAAYTDASGVKSLAAYVVPMAGAAPLDPAAVRAALSKTLPDFMTPSQVLVLDALPLSSNGKVDRKALPNPTTRPSESAFVAPRNDSETVLAEIWSELLGGRPVGVTDNFFALGGHSLLAVMLVAEIKRRLKVEVPLSAVLEQPTVAGLAELVTKPVADGKTRHLVTLRATGNRPPIVLVAGVGGYAFTYQRLSTLLGGEQPVYALKAVGAEKGAELIDRSVEEVSAIYESEILETLPAGPVVLGGFSLGMLPAFELAHRLRAQGRPVPLLVSFDAFAPGYPQRLSGVDRWLAHARGLLESTDRLAYLRDRLQNVRGRVLNHLGRAEDAVPDLNLEAVDAELLDHLRKLWVIQANARQAYRPSYVEPSALLLIRSETPMRWPATRMDDPLHGWYSFVRGPISVVTIPGDHETLFSADNQPLMAETIADHVHRYAMSGTALVR